MSDLSRLNTNLFSLQLRSQVNLTNRRLSNTLQRLSTGKKINRAEDDPAGFSIAAKLEARVRGITQALDNTGDAKSMLNIAESSLTQINDLLIKIKQKTIRAANAVPGTVERDFIRNEINGLAREIDAIIDQTTFNDVNLLDGTFSGQFQVGERSADTLSLTLDEDLTPQDLQVLEVSSEGVLTSTGTVTAASNLNDLDQFEALQAGDEFDIVLTRGDGTQVTTTFTAAGNKGELTSSAIQDVVDTINATGVFNASFDSGDEAIKVQEATLTNGNGLNVEFDNFQEFPGTDGATASVNLSFNAATGNLETSFTSSGAVNGSTRLNDLDQFDQLEGQDEIIVELTEREGTTSSVAVTLPEAEATPSNFTINDLANAINAQAGGSFTASVDASGQIVVSEDDIAQFNFDAVTSFIENDLDTGNASVSNTNFNEVVESVSSDTISGVSSSDTLNSTSLGNNFDTGDSFDITLTANDGSTEQITFTFGSPNDTVGDLVNEISSNTNFTAAVSGGRIEITEDNETVGGNLDVSLSNFNDAANGDATFNGDTFSGETTLTSRGELSPTPFNTGTLLNDLNEFSNVQAGDTLEIQATAADGSDESFIFTFTGSEDGASDSTVQDLIDSINANTGLTAAFDSTDSAIIISDSNTSGNSLSLSFSNSDFTEDPRPLTAVTPNPPLDFSFNGTALESQQLQVSGVNAGSGTRINDLDGFDNIEGDDRIDITLQNRAGQSNTVSFVFDDVAPGDTSNRTVGDLVNFLDGQTVNGVEMDAQLSGGRILIEEVNPPDIGGFGSSTTFNEEDIDIEPKQFTSVDFEISDFLRVSDSTGLVIGLNLLDFDAGNQLTQEVAQFLIENVNDSIDRITGELNKLGTFQMQLTNREIQLSASSNANQAALSRIEDADLARETSILTQQIILQQFQIAALAQANIFPQRLLNLL